MGGLVFVVAIAAAMIAMIWRKVAAKRKRHRYHESPGRSLEQAWVVHALRDMDPLVEAIRCHCGGKPIERARSKLPDVPDVHVVACECRRCEEKIRLYFRLVYLN